MKRKHQHHPKQRKHGKTKGRKLLPPKLRMEAERRSLAKRGLTGENWNGWTLENDWLPN